MHTSYTVFPFRVFSSEHWFIIWAIFSIKVAKTKSPKEECAPGVERTRCIRSLDVSDDNRILNPRTKEHVNKWYAALCQIISNPGHYGKESAPVYREQQRTGLNPQHPLQGLLRPHRSIPKHSPAPAAKWDAKTSVQHKTWSVWRKHKSLCRHLSNEPSLYKRPAQICTFITPCPSRVLPKTLIISVLHEGHSNCFIITTAADYQWGKSNWTVILWTLLRGALYTFSLLSSCRDKQWKVFNCQLDKSQGVN